MAVELTKEVAKVVSEFLLKEELTGEGLLNQIGEVRTGVLNGDRIYLSTESEIQGAVKGSCSPTYTSPDLYGAKEVSGITACQIAREWCADDIEDELKRNESVMSLDENEAVVATIKNKVGKTFANSVATLGFFADPTSSNSALNFGPLGIFPQMTDIVATATTQYVDYSTTSGASDALITMDEQAKEELTTAEDSYVLMNKAFFNALRRECIAQKWELQSAKDEFFKGLEVYEVLGFKVVVAPFLDKAMKMTGNVLAGKKEVALLTTKSNLRIVTSEDKFGDTVNVTLSTEEKSGKIFVKIDWAQSSAIVEDDMFVICY